MTGDWSPVIAAAPWMRDLRSTHSVRDGTFLIRDGKIAHPVRNLRYTQSVLDAFSNVQAISRERKLQGRALVPALKLANFRFTGSTEF